MTRGYFEPTWEQKLDALAALGRDIALKMRKPGDWYVEHVGVEMKESPDAGVLIGAYGNGATPEEAVEDHWRQLALCESPAMIVVNAYSGNRRHVRWNGYMWQDVPLPQVAVR